MFFVGYISSEMASQKWIVFAFLALCTFMVEVRSSSASVEELIQQIEKTITALKNCNFNCSGKSPNCTVKVKERRDEQRFHIVLHRKSLFVLNNLVIHTQADKYQKLLPQLLPATQNRIICRFRI